MYNQANQMTKAVHDMTADERAELFKALTLEQKDAFAMDQCGRCIGNKYKNN